MKKFVALLLVCLFVFFIPMGVMAVNTPIDLYLNGKKLHNNYSPLVINNHTYIHFKTLADEFGVDVNWNEVENKVTIKHDNLKIEMFTNKKEVLVNNKLVLINIAPFVEKNHIYIPLQFIGNQLGIKMIWDVLTQSVMLYKKDRSFLTTKELFEIEPTEGNTILPSNVIGKPNHNTPNESISTLMSIVSVNNQISLQFDSVVTPISFYLIDPHRFVVDLPASQMTPQLANSKELLIEHYSIKKIRYAMHDAKTVRVVVDLHQPSQFNTVIDMNTNKIDIHLIEKLHKVVLDPGHGGKDPGADGASGRYEKHFTLELSNKIKALLDKEPQIIGFMTRTDDSFMSLDDRVMFANLLDADLFISLHGNTFTSPISGSETYYWHRESINFAFIMHKHVLEGAKLPDRNIRKVQYRVLRDTHMPSALLELGYLSNVQEEKIMLSNEFQTRLAASIVNGIKEYLDIK